MEVLIPLLTLGGLYLASNTSNTGVANTNTNRTNMTEGFERLPNTQLPDRNFSTEFGDNADVTAQLSTLNTYAAGDAGAYTDKYFYQKEHTISPSSSSSSSPAGNEQFTALSGQQVPASYFSKHSNPVPFFGGRLRSRADPSSSESYLDNAVGSGSQHIVKSEQAPLFQPMEHANWAYGAPSNSDFIQSRMHVSQKMNSVMPFESERVAPGLGLGAGTQGTGGFNNGMMSRELWMDKGVDDLRVETKSKASEFSFLGYEGPAMGKVVNRGILGAVEKNRPDRAFEWGADRLFTSTGAEKGVTNRSVQLMQDTSRADTTTSYVGNAKYNNEHAYVTGEYMPSKHIDLGTLPLTGASMTGKQDINESDYGVKTQTAYGNNRSANRQPDDMLGILGGVIGAAVAPLLDVLRPSRRENTTGTMRPYQNVRMPVSAPYLHDPTNRPAPTIRDMNCASAFHMNVNAAPQGAHSVTGSQLRVVQRPSTDREYSGVAGAASAHNMRSNEDVMNQRNNETRQDLMQGYMVQGNMSLHNSDINMRMSGKDAYLSNNRPLAPAGIPQGPNAQLRGENTTWMSPVQSNMQSDRNADIDVQGILKRNPLAITRTAFA